MVRWIHRTVTGEHIGRSIPFEYRIGRPLKLPPYAYKENVSVDDWRRANGDAATSKVGERIQISRSRRMFGCRNVTNVGNKYELFTIEKNEWTDSG